MSGVASRVRIEGGEGAPGEGRRASRRRLPHPAKRLLPLNRQNRIYLTQPWRRRRRVRASLPRHAVARRARFRCFHSSLPFRNPRRPHPLPFPPRSTPTYPPPPVPFLSYPGKPSFPSFLPSFFLAIYVCVYIYISFSLFVCVRVRVSSRTAATWFGFRSGRSSCPDTRRFAEERSERGRGVTG